MADENIPASSVALLRQTGQSVQTVVDLDLVGASDDEIVAAAKKNASSAC
ncbi:MAG: DUF5615 family PIN-like protein [Thermoplasmatota archaeon]